MPANPAESIRQAVELARAGNPAKGLEILESSQAEARPDASPYGALHHYTLGNLHLELGQPGQALAHLDLARRLAGGPGAIPGLAGSLGAARDQCERAAGSVVLDRSSSWIERAVEHPLFVPAEALMAVFALSVALRAWRGPRAAAGHGVLAGRALLVWGLALGLGVCHWIGLRSAPGRVLMASSLRSGPSEDFVVLGLAPAGATVRLVEHRGTWSNVRLAPGLSGWVESDRLLLFEGPWTTARGR